MSKNYSSLKLNYKIWIETDQNKSVFGEGKWELLKAIKETGSLKAAVDKLGIGYRRTWDNLKKIEDTLGYHILEKSRGGADGGQTVLTPEGEKLVAVFEKFHKNFDSIINATFELMLKELNENQ
jgi:molybdate transport system regulatory protein